MNALPWSQEAEVSVIGSLLLTPRAMADVGDVLEPQDFYHPAHAAIYASITALDADGRPIDPLTVASHMRAAGTFQSLRAHRDEVYLSELTSAVVTVENVAYHAQIVRAKSTARRLIEAAAEIASKARAEDDDPDALSEQAERLVMDVTQRSQRSGISSAKEVLARSVTALEARAARPDALTGVTTGFPDLDALTGGWQASELVIIAGRPSMGKSALAMACAANAAMPEKGEPVPSLVFSLEMSKESLMNRLICTEARIDSALFKSGKLRQADWVSFTRAAARISEAPISFDDTGAPRMREIRSKCRRWRSRISGPALVVVDYMQLISAEREKGKGREQEVSEISRGLKALAKELEVSVIALSQLNRGVESRADKRPMMSDLRESGAIEQDADVIAFLYRDEVYDKETKKPGVAEVIVSKHRNGDIGIVELNWTGKYTRFDSRAQTSGY